MEGDFVVDYLTREAIQQCARHDTSIQRFLMQFMIRWLLVSRERDLIRADDETTLNIYQSMYEQIIDNGPVVRMLKLTYFFKNSTTEFEDVQKKYERIAKEKLIPLLENICYFTGTSKNDLDEIFKKITIYIIASNKIFSTKNSQMMSEAKCALRSILTTQDLLDFVTRKKHYRLDYLDRLGKIMCGILLFNKHAGLGGDAIRDVVNDIHVAYQNTLESVRINMTKCSELITHGLRALSGTVTVNLVDSKFIYRLPEGICTDDLELFNKFIYMHLQHETFLHQLREPLNRLKNLIEYNVGQLKDVIFKLHEVVKFRLAIPSELVFPHFTKLFDTWYQLLMQLYYLVEINQINDQMTALVSNEYPFEEMASKISAIEPIKTKELTIEHMVNEDEDLPMLRMKRKSDSMLVSSHPLQRFCALTMALSNGILIAAETSYGVLPFQEQFMAFKRKDYAAFAEKNYKNFVKYFLRTAFQNPEMCLLFNIPIDTSPLCHADKNARQNAKTIAKKKTFDASLQTENCLPPSTLESRTTYSWNIWDYRRRAIQLANLRKCQTHATQTNITYSCRDAAIQTYNKTSM